jgi:hypothetical protein
MVKDVRGYRKGDEDEEREGDETEDEMNEKRRRR